MACCSCRASSLFRADADSAPTVDGRARRVGREEEEAVDVSDWEVEEGVTGRAGGRLPAISVVSAGGAVAAGRVESSAEEAGDDSEESDERGTGCWSAT